MNGSKYDDTMLALQLQTADNAMLVTEYREKVKRLIDSAGASDQTLMSLSKA